MDDLPEQIPPITLSPPRPRLAYRIGNWLPRPLRVLYYIVLYLTLIYIIYRIVEWVLKTIQKIGYFLFEPRNYWTMILSIFTVAICSFILAQFVLGLDPVGKVLEWGLEQLQSWGIL